MKVSISGKTPMERLINFTKKVVQVSKAEIQDKRPTKTKRRRGRAGK